MKLWSPALSAVYWLTFAEVSATSLADLGSVNAKAVPHAFRIPYNLLPAKATLLHQALSSIDSIQLADGAKR